MNGVVVDNVSIPESNGRSSETILFDASWTRGGQREARTWVARVAPSTAAVVYTYDLEAEFRVMKAFSEHTDVPAPGVVFFEADAGVFGAPFIVMERLYGRTPGDDPPFTMAGWVLELSDDQRRRLYDNALRVLGRIHATDWRALGLDVLAKPELGPDPVEQQLRYWRSFHAWAMRGAPSRVVEETFDWLERHRPTEPEPLLVSWGDARLGNLMFGDDMEVTGVLDWELATLASPEYDLGWWVFANRHHGPGMGSALPPGILDTEGTYERYAQLTGHEVRHGHFYEVFGGLRFAVLMERAGHLLLEAGALPPGHTMSTSNPATHLLAALIGVEAPEGDSSTFLGAQR